jgi:hypothetical protein
MIGEPAGEDLAQPFPLFGDRQVHHPPHLPFDFLELGSHPVGARLPHDEKSSGARFPADEREAQKIEGFRLALAASRPGLNREAAELDETRLVLVQ